jgi:hypothetical protein
MVGCSAAGKAHSNNSFVSIILRMSCDILNIIEGQKELLESAGVLHRLDLSPHLLAKFSHPGGAVCKLSRTQRPLGVDALFMAKIKGGFGVFTTLPPNTPLIFDKINARRGVYSLSPSLLPLRAARRGEGVLLLVGGRKAGETLSRLLRATPSPPPLFLFLK